MTATPGFAAGEGAMLAFVKHAAGFWAKKNIGCVGYFFRFLKGLLDEHSQEVSACSDSTSVHEV